jgi:hypothetical protein
VAQPQLTAPHAAAQQLQAKPARQGVGAHLHTHTHVQENTGQQVCLSCLQG